MRRPANEGRPFSVATAGSSTTCPFKIGAKGPAQACAAAMSPWLTYCIEQFGPDRCMLESNFPPDKVSFSYNVMYNAFKILTRSYSATERADMLHDTAVRAYRIDV